jgi:heterodisulfide reductase subunit A
MANIRDQDSWVHQAEPEKATRKAKDLVRMAVAKASLLEPLERMRADLEQAALVVGGGVAGMSAALNLADQGLRTFLVEEREELGGNALKIKRTWKGDDVQAFVQALRERVSTHANIEVLLNTKIINVQGFVGQFSTTVLASGTEKKLLHGVTILASGGEAFTPDEYLYGRSDRVTRWHELEDLFEKEPGRLEETNAVAFIQCVGSREPNRPYCSKICCTGSVSQAIELKTRKPDLQVYVLYRDLRTYGLREELYTRARSMGIIFIRFPLDQKPVVEPVMDNGSEKILISVKDHILDRTVQLKVDYLNLASAIIPKGGGELSKLFNVPLNEDGFFLEAHMKLRPVEFASEGVFVCGLAHYPKSMDESIAQANAAAAKAAVVLSRPFIEVEPVVSVINPDLCIGCGLCEKACPFGAMRREEITGKGYRAESVPASCKGCGVCAAACPQKAIDIKHFTNEQLVAAIRAGGAEE